MRLLNRFLCILFALLTALCLCPAAFASEVEQVQVEMPDISVYFYGDDDVLSGVSAEDVRASLDGGPLTVTGFEPTEQGIYYIYAMDVSGSIPAAYFSAAKDAIYAAYGKLRPQDRLALLTFGSEVTVRLSGGEGADEVRAILDSLEAADTETMFYAAMDTLVSMLTESSDMRRIAVVVSDGQQDGNSETTLDELKQTLVRSGVSVSAMCLDSVAESLLTDFRGVIELSGGELRSFGPSNAGEVLDGILDGLRGSWLLRLQADSNLVDGASRELSVDLGGTETLDLQITPEKWKPDETAPSLDSVSYDEALGCFLLVFSEPVSGAEKPDAYQFTADGAALAVTSVEPVDPCSVRVYTEDVAAANAVSLTLRGVTDVSMESNALQAFSELVYPEGAVVSPATPAPEEPAAESPAEERSDPDAAGAPILFFGIGVVGLAVLAVLVLLSVKHVRSKKEPRDRAAEKEEKAELQPNTTRTKFMFYNENKGGGKRGE